MIGEGQISPGVVFVAGEAIHSFVIVIFHELFDGFLESFDLFDVDFVHVVPFDFFFVLQSGDPFLVQQHYFCLSFQVLL